jgi:hypothetical protein
LKKNPRDDNELGASQLVVISCIWGKKPNDNVKRLIVVFCTWEKNQEMTTTFLARHHLLHLEKKTKRWWEVSWLIIIFYTWEKTQRDDDESLGSLSFSTLEKKKKKRWRWAMRLIIICCTWGKNQETFVAFLVLFMHFSIAEESQINAYYYGYIVGCLQ